MRTLRCVVILVLLAGWVVVAPAQSVGDRVRLEAAHPQGVPVHPAAGDPSFLRWPNGALGTVREIDPATGWFRVESNGSSGWVVKRYLTVVPADDIDAALPDEGLEALSYAVGTWNLEHLRDGASRGFPENTFGGPSYGSRTVDDFAQIADIIRSRLAAAILVLTEINGRADGRSTELDRLLEHLGQGWAYEITRSGASQRIAMLYDTRAARRERCVEMEFPPQDVQGKDVFDRDPLVCRFTFLAPSGQARNDVLVVGVHLASGQHLTQNHNTAMSLLRQRLGLLSTDGTFPPGERDVLIAGDFNASRFDNRLEDFWDGFDPNRFRFETLAPQEADDYPPTRLAGVPLFPRSQIDYIMGSGAPGGIADELVFRIAQVHTELLPEDFDEFRRHLSDHLPVTVRVRVVADSDP